MVRPLVCFHLDISLGVRISAVQRGLKIFRAYRGYLKFFIVLFCCPENKVYNILFLSTFCRPPICTLCKTVYGGYALYEYLARWWMSFLKRRKHPE